MCVSVCVYVFIVKLESYKNKFVFNLMLTSRLLIKTIIFYLYHFHDYQPKKTQLNWHDLICSIYGMTRELVYLFPQKQCFSEILPRGGAEGYQFEWGILHLDYPL